MTKEYTVMGKTFTAESFDSVVKTIPQGQVERFLNSVFRQINCPEFINKRLNIIISGYVKRGLVSQ